MYFKSLTATYGKLQNDTLSLSPGLNCIYAPNESGKSTWCRFIISMLYGLPTRERSPYSDKVRALPWSGHAPQGTAEIEANGTAYTVTRTSRRGGAPMGTLSCTYSATGDAVANICADTIGEWLVGVPREVYERSAFIAQSGLAVAQSVVLERRIAALITTGEQDASFSEIYSRLHLQRNRRRHHKTGQIPLLESECASLERKLQQLDALQQQREDLVRQLQRAERSAAELEEYQSRWDLLHAQNEARRLLERQVQAEQKLQLLHKRAAEATTLRDAHPLHGTAPDIPPAHLHPPPDKPLPAALFWILSVLFAAASICFFFLHFPLWSLLCAAAVALGTALCGLILTKKRKDYLAACQRQSDTAAKLREQMTHYEQLVRNAQQAQSSWEDYRALCAQLPPLPQVSLAPVQPPLLSADSTARNLRQAKEQISHCRSRLDHIEGQLSAADNRDTIATQLAAKRERLARLQAEYDALTMAMETLVEANTELQERFSPELGRRSAEIFEKLSAGRYDKVTLGRDFSVCAASPEDSILRALPLLSQGAGDQLYLSVRLAICEMVLPSENPAPLILDDALVSFDDERMQAALELLHKLSETRQILLFTCQHREEVYLRGCENVTFLSL